MSHIYKYIISYIYPKTPNLCYSHAFPIPCHSRVLGEMLLFTYFVIKYVNTTSNVTYVPFLAAKAPSYLGHWWRTTSLMDHSIKIGKQGEYITMIYLSINAICYMNHCSHDWSTIFSFPKGKLHWAMPMLASLIKGAPSLWHDCMQVAAGGGFGSKLAIVASLTIRITLGWQPLAQPFFHQFPQALAAKRSSDCPSCETRATHLVQPWRWSTSFTLWPSTCRTGMGREIILNNKCWNKIMGTCIWLHMIHG